MANFYPRITEDTTMSLELIRRSIEKTPGYLDAADCPYSEQLKGLLRPVTAEVIDAFDGVDEVEAIDDLLKKALNDLEAMAATMTNADPSDKLNYLKTKTSLLEKLISLREKVFSLRELQEFRATVLTGLDQICTPDQITDFMKRLDGVLGIGDDKDIL